MTTTPTPAEVEAFRKGLEDERLVPDGWLYEKAYGWRYLCEEGDRQPRTCSALDIQAMEGLAGRVLRDKGHTVAWLESRQHWAAFLVQITGTMMRLPGNKDEHLPALVEAVRRVGG